MSTAALQQRTPQWHAARKGKLTASNVGSVLGLCPWTSRVQAYNRAMGAEQFVGNDATRWGTANESNGILAYSAHTGNVVENTGLHVHPHTTWLAGSPDGLIGSEGLLEVKCPYNRKAGGTRVHKSIPAHYYMQMNLCLECTERAWCDFISWSTDGYKIYRITRDKELHEALTPYYLSFFAAMQREASAPPPLPKKDREEITRLVAESMTAHINYEFWDRVDLQQSPPRPCESDTDEEPPSKMQKTSDN